MTRASRIPSNLPRRFTVGLQHGGFHGGGHVIVDRDALVASPGSVGRALQPHLLPDGVPLEPVEHVGTRVVVILGRIPAPVVNTVLLVQSEDRTVAASFPPWNRRALLASLREAGFQVVLDRRLFAVGEPHVRPWP